MISSVAPNERATFMAVNILHGAHEDQVIATREGLVQRAGKAGYYAGHQRNTVPARRPFDAGKAILFLPTGKARRNVLLAFAQYVYGKWLNRRQPTQKAGAPVNADQH
jgi:hypothetical protein